MSLDSIPISMWQLGIALIQTRTTWPYFRMLSMFVPLTQISTLRVVESSFLSHSIFFLSSLHIFWQSALMSENRARGVKKFVKKVECVQKRSLWQYQFGKDRTFFKITVAIPALVPASKRILEKGISLGSNGNQINV